MSTYDDASLIMYPSGYKADKIYSLKPTDGSGDLTFTRASTATRVNESGLIESVASGVPRIDYTGGGCGKFLFEPQRTNLYTYSEEFDNAAWNKTNSTITANDTTSPDGTVNADKIVEDTTASDKHAINQFITTTSSTSYIAYIFAKKSERDFIYFRSSVASSFNLQWFDLTNKTVGGTVGSFDDAGIIEYPNDWVLCYVKKTEITGTSRVFQWALSTGDLIETYTGDGTSGAFLWGAQVEAGSYPTSYIPTAGATATRLQDESNTTGLSSVINSSEGVLYFEGSALADDGTNRWAAALSDGTNLERVQIIYESDNSISASVISSNISQCSFNYSGSSATDFNKIAISYKQNDFKMYVNGVQVGTDTSGNAPSGLDTLGFERPTGVSQFYGNVQNLMVFPTALTDAQLATLTTL